MKSTRTSCGRLSSYIEETELLKLPDPLLHVVYDKDDLAENARFVSSLDDLDGGRVVVNITPDGRNLDWLAADIERGLGKNPHVSGAGRNANDRWTRIHAWLVGGGVESLFVSRIQLLDGRRLKPVIDLALACGVDLWLVAQQDPLPRTIRGLLEDWPVEEVSVSDFRKRWRRSSTSKAKADAGTVLTPTFPRVPHDEFVLFRAACRDLLMPTDFKIVDRAFQASAAEVADWLQSQDAIGEEEVGRLVRDIVAPCRGLDEALTRLRGAQVAFFWRRYLLKLDADRIVAAYAIEEKSELNRTTAAQLRSYAATRYPAAAALALATDWSPLEVSSIAIADIGVDATSMSLAGFGDLSDEAAKLIAPHLVSRLLDGASEEDPLFILHTTDESRRDDPATDRAIERMLNLILREVGVRITASRSYSGLRGRSKGWRWREGVSVQAIETSVGA
jgi:hypothetical protein